MFKTTTLPLIVLLAACAAKEPSPMADPTPKRPLPDIEVTLAANVVQITAHFPQGGYALKLVGSERDGDHTVIKLCMSTPSPDSMHMMALEDKTVSHTVSKDSGPLHLLLQVREEGKTYDEEPTFDLLRVVNR